MTLLIDARIEFVRRVVLSSFQILIEKTFKFPDISSKSSYPLSFLIKFLDIRSPMVSSCLLFLVDVREGSDYNCCHCSAVDVATEVST